MLKMFHYMKERWHYIVMIILLLFVQAFCDLSLPDYTSKIVNVGIQQKGVEDGVPETIEQKNLETLLLFMEQEEQDTVLNAYEIEDEQYRLKKITKEEREELNSILGIPELIAGSMKAEELQAAAQMPKEQREAFLGDARAKLEEIPDSIITQKAVSFVQEEYKQQGQDMDKLQTNYILFSGLKMLGLAFLAMAAAVMVTFLSSQVAATLGRNLRNSVYRKVISFSGEELNHFSIASLITRSTNDVQQVQMLFTMLFRIVLYAPILGIGGVYKVFQTDASMTWILALAVVVITLFVFLVFKLVMPKFTKLQYLIDELNLVAREILTGVPVIRAFSREKHEEERFEDANAKLTKTNLFVNRCMTFMMPFMMLLMNAITVLIVWNGSHAVDAGNMQVGNMMAFMQYAMQIIMAFLMITMMSIMIPRANVAAKRINEIMETEVSIKDEENPVQPKEEQKGEVVFEHVGFAYPGADGNSLTDISFSAKKGETVAFIGSTGSGKSTLVNLIPRFFDVTEGRILVDGVDIRQMPLHELRERIGYVPQKGVLFSTLVNLIPRFFDVTEGRILVDGVDIRQMPLHELRERIGYVPQKGVLFSGTIDSNIRYGKEAATEAEVQRAAEIAQAWDFIEEKEDGVQSAIAQGGTNVSGGQKQRLSIARAIAKNPEIYIFDDSFSALDYKTDVVLRRALKKETKDATTLIVAQRISTILHADKILVLDEGHVVGQGTHKELLKSCDVYRQIAMSQLSEEELADE